MSVGRRLSLVEVTGMGVPALIGRDVRST